LLSHIPTLLPVATVVLQYTGKLRVVVESVILYIYMYIHIVLDVKSLHHKYSSTRDYNCTVPLSYKSDKDTLNYQVLTTVVQYLPLSSRCGILKP
jgi:hypothetical protein